jgi:hypothetical protein
MAVAHRNLSGIRAGQNDVPPDLVDLENEDGARPLWRRPVTLVASRRESEDGLAGLIHVQEPGQRWRAGEHGEENRDHLRYFAALAAVHQLRARVDALLDGLAV